jgi:hypothetical protein
MINNLLEDFFFNNVLYWVAWTQTSHMYLEFALYNLWCHHFQYNISYYLGFTYILKLLHMYLNFGHEMNRNKNIIIKIENEKII